MKGDITYTYAITSNDQTVSNGVTYNGTNVTRMKYNGNDVVHKHVDNRDIVTAKYTHTVTVGEPGWDNDVDSDTYGCFTYFRFTFKTSVASYINGEQSGKFTTDGSSHARVTKITFEPEGELPEGVSISPTVVYTDRGTQAIVEPQIIQILGYPETLPTFSVTIDTYIPDTQSYNFVYVRDIGEIFMDGDMYKRDLPTVVIEHVDVTQDHDVTYTGSFLFPGSIISGEITTEY